MRFPLFLLLILAFSFTAFSKSEVRTHSAGRIDTLQASPVIDGKLNEPAWLTVQPATDFTQQAPQPGEHSTQLTEVRIMYTDEAIFIGARMFDSSPDSILHQLGTRDDYTNNTDAFGVMFDTYHDRRNAFFFAVTAAGVQTDSRFVFDKSDISLNSVWYSKVLIDSLGWTVEMKIPYQALRFPNQDEQVWGINYTRIIRRYREQSWWNSVDPNIAGIVNQCGDLNGISGIKSPVRLALFPYISGYYQLYDGSATRSLNGGMDIKYGLNESFTLDMTLVPDFGQTLSDNLVLNLSPFEVRYDERRYFFTEGTELFNRNDLFYSRRIGAQPPGYFSVTDQLDGGERIVSNPVTTRLYNAIKLSGRTRSKTGIGFFNALAAPAYAVAEDTLTGVRRDIKTSPLTNYNCLVIEQIIGKNSYVGFMNTTVFRFREGDDAMVNSVQFRAAGSSNKFAVEGYVDHSITGEVNSYNGIYGFRYHIEGGKVKGPFIAKLRHHLVSNTFNSNDMGYLDRNNYYNFGATAGYNVFTPSGRLLWMINEVNADISYMYDSKYRTFFTITGRHIYTFRNWMTTGINWLTNPIVSYDFFETRTHNRFLLYPKNFELGGFISSDYRKILALDLSASYRIFLERDRRIIRYGISPRWRATDKLFIVYRWDQELKNDNVGYVTNESPTEIVFGLRNMNTVTSTLTTTYNFTASMGLSLRVRHYWSEVDYREYFLLQPDGTMAHYDYTGNADISFNAFNVDLIYTWQFLPGSELSVAWKNSILSTTNTLAESYGEDLNYIFDFPQSNSFSVKMIWYLDAGRFIKKKKS